MQKTLIALAVAGVAAAPLAAQATSHISYSGIVEMEYNMPDNGATDDMAEVNGGDVLFLISASTMTNAGLEAYANYRLDGGTSGTGVTSDVANVGLKGNFGDFRMGEVSDPYHMGQLVGDAYDDAGGGSPAGSTALGYTNTFGAVKVAVSHAPEGSGDDTAIGAQLDISGITVGFASQSDHNGLAGEGGTIFGAKATFGMFTVALQSQDDDGEAGTAFLVGWSDGGDLSADFSTYSHDLEDDDGTRINVNYNLGGGASVNLRNNAGREGSENTRILLAVSF